MRSQQHPGYMTLGSEKQGFVLEQCLEDQFISPFKFREFLHETITDLLGRRGEPPHTSWNEMRRSLENKKGLKKIELDQSNSNLRNNVVLKLSLSNVFSFDLCLIPCITDDKRRRKSGLILEVFFLNCFCHFPCLARR